MRDFLLRKGLVFGISMLLVAVTISSAINAQIVKTPITKVTTATEEANDNEAKTSIIEVYQYRFGVRDKKNETKITVSEDEAEQLKESFNSILNNQGLTPDEKIEYLLGILREKDIIPDYCTYENFIESLENWQEAWDDDDILQRMQPNVNNNKIIFLPFGAFSIVTLGGNFFPLFIGSYEITSPVKKEIYFPFLDMTFNLTSNAVQAFWTVLVAPSISTFLFATPDIFSLPLFKMEVSPFFAFISGYTGIGVTIYRVDEGKIPISILDFAIAVCSVSGFLLL